MGGGIVGRDRELRALQAILDQARLGTTAVILDGQAGIGKTTLCRAVTEAAQAAGFAVLTTAGAAAEVSLAWTGLADLAAGIDAAALDELSPLHRQALQAVTTGLDAPGGDERLIASAFRTALERLCARQPVLLAVDDAQWLDEASGLALGFTVRRLHGPVAVFASYRSGEPDTADRSWVQPPDPQSRHHLILGPLEITALEDLITDRLGQRPPRSTMARIHALSAGNPFYALELARTVQEGPDGELGALPPTLAQLLRGRLAGLDPAATAALVSCAAAFEPTVDMIATATDRSPVELVEVLRPVEDRGLLVFDGTRIRFTHPLIASAVTTDADPAALREAHRRLAQADRRPEPHARHLALSGPYGDTDTLAALDSAGESAAAKGAYSTAAELVGWAIRLGGDDHMRRLRAAEYRFRAGAFDQAEALLAPIIEELPAGFLRAVGLMLLAAVRGYRDGIVSTIGLFQRATQEAGDFAPLRTQALLLSSLATGIGGDMATCVRDARRARADADETGLPELRGQALSLWAHVSFMYGLGVDSQALRTALDIEDPDTDAPVMLRPTPVYALNCAWTGRLDEARSLMTQVYLRCEERGSELDVLWAAEALTWIDVAQGRYADAGQDAADALRRAEQIGGRLPLITAHTALAQAAAYQGKLEDARAAAELAVTEANAAGLHYLAAPPLMSLAFVQVSDTQYDAALQTLKPLLENFDAAHHTEIMAGAYLPDAVEALTAMGRVDEAEPLTAALQINGARHDRPWMLAMGARCRALICAANGELDAALESAQRALAHHDRLPMPFERARTALLVGQLQRRRRRTAAAHTNLTEAVAVFADLGSPLWAARAGGELARLSARSPGAALTDSERQVAEQAAAGMSNKEIAASMYLSAKTVEMHLSSAYRKLGIRSRAQLAERLQA